jgi:hypothetical protein
MSLENDGGMMWTGKRKELEEKHIPVELCPPKSHID